MGRVVVLVVDEAGGEMVGTGIVVEGGVVVVRKIGVAVVGRDVVVVGIV